MRANPVPALDTYKVTRRVHTVSPLTFRPLETGGDAWLVHLVSFHLPCSALSACGPSAMDITTHPGGGGARSGGDSGELPVASTSSSVPDAYSRLQPLIHGLL